MTTQTETRTIRIERTIKAPAERVYKALLDPTTMSKAMSGPGWTTAYTQLEPKIGGKYRQEMKRGDGGGQAFHGEFLELDEFTRIRYSYAFDTDNEAMQTDMEIVWTLEETDGVTRLVFEQIGIPDPIPTEAAAKGHEFGIDQLVELIEGAA